MVIASTPAGAARSKRKSRRPKSWSAELVVNEIGRVDGRPRARSTRPIAPGPQAGSHITAGRRSTASSASTAAAEFVEIVAAIFERVSEAWHQVLPPRGRRSRYEIPARRIHRLLVTLAD